MKTNVITITSRHYDSALEDHIKSTHIELKEQAIKNGQHFGKQKRPLLIGDNLSPYVDALKAGYEKLAAEITQRLQPAAHFPEAKIDHDFFKDKEVRIAEQIKKLENENNADKYSLGNFNPGHMIARFRWAIISSMIIMLGEIVFNTRAFVLFGDNLIIALIFSFSLSFAVCVFAHIVPILYRKAKNTFQRRTVVIASLLSATAVFTAIAVLRTLYLANNNVKLNPFYFIVFNLFFFIVSVLLSFFTLPTLKEIKQYATHLKLYYKIRKREKKIEQLYESGENLKASHVENNKQRLGIVQYSSDSTEVVRKMYRESIGIFQTSNLIVRDDGTPDCFSKPLPELDIADFAINIQTTNRKVS